MKSKSIWIVYYTPLDGRNTVQIVGAYATKELALKRAEGIKDDFWLIDEVVIEEDYNSVKS